MRAYTCFVPAAGAVVTAGARRFAIFSFLVLHGLCGVRARQRRRCVPVKGEPTVVGFGT